MYVTDTGNHRIEKFDREGNFITQWGGFGNGEGQFNFPYGIAVDARGSVFVVDSGNTRVQQFMPADEGSERLQEVAEAAANRESAKTGTIDHGLDRHNASLTGDYARERTTPRTHV